MSFSEKKMLITSVYVTSRTTNLLPSESGKEFMMSINSSNDFPFLPVKRSAVDAKWLFSSSGSASSGCGFSRRIRYIIDQISLGLLDDKAFS